MTTEPEMVELVAEAIWQAEWTRAGNRGRRRVPWTDNSPEHMDRYRFLARAAIEALVEPTEEMLVAGKNEIGHVSTDILEAGNDWVGQPRVVWQAMLSAALRSSLIEGEGE